METDFIEPKRITEAMKQALARMYGDGFMREYLINTIAINKHNSLTLLSRHQPDDARDYLSKAKALEQLLKIGKENFIHFEGLKNLKDPLRSLEVKEVKL